MLVDVALFENLIARTVNSRARIPILTIREDQERLAARSPPSVVLAKVEPDPFDPAMVRSVRAAPPYRVRPLIAARRAR